MKRPLGVVALLYGGGVLLAAYVHPPLIALFCVSFVLTAGALLWTRARGFLLGLLLVFTGWTNFTCRTAILSPHDLRRLLGEAPQLATVRGQLIETPKERVYVRDDQTSVTTQARVRVVALRRKGKWQSAEGRILVSMRGKLSRPCYAGQEVILPGVIAPPLKARTEGLFDYRTYLHRRGIDYRLKVYSPGDWQLVGHPAEPFSDRFLAWARRTLAHGLPERDEPLKLLWAMTLGWKTALPRQAYQPFVESGTRHIFAVSGLHVALIAGILLVLLRTLQVGRLGCGAVVVPLLWFYVAATGWQSSAIRATLMMSVLIGGWALKRPSDLLNSLAAAALIILLWDPRQLFQASFQLSFFVVLSIALLVPPLKRLCDRWFVPDPLLPRELLPRWRRGFNIMIGWLTLSLATSFAAWLGALPLIAYYFHILSPITILANLAIVPLSSAALASAMGSLICGAWLPWASVLFNFSAWFWMALILHTSQWAAALPGAYFYVRSPPMWGFAVYYSVLVGTLTGGLFRPRVWPWTLAAGVLVLGFAGWEWHRARAEFAVTVLPLSGGHGVFVDGPGGQGSWLVDCGDRRSVQFMTEPFLHAHGVNTVAHLILTHGDARHVAGTPLLRRDFPIAKIYTSPLRFRSGAYRSIVRALKAAPARHETVSRGDRLGPWTILHPAATDDFRRADDGSLVLMGRFHQTRILLLGDLGRAGQEALLERSPDLRADIVVSGLPAKGEPLGNGLLDAVRPRLIIVADSNYPATARAGPKLQKRLAGHGIAVIYTREAGAVTIRIGPAGILRIESPLSDEIQE